MVLQFNRLQSRPKKKKRLINLTTFQAFTVPIQDNEIVPGKKRRYNLHVAALSHPRKAATSFLIPLPRVLNVY